MQAENPLHTPEMNPFHFPERLDERKEYKRRFNLVLTTWAGHESSDNPFINDLSMTALVANDCHRITSMEAELERQGYNSESRLQRWTAERRILEHLFISKLANNTDFDAVTILNPEFATTFGWMAKMAEESSDESRFQEAVVSLRRLFTAREQLAHLDGITKFDTTDFKKILTDILSEEEQLRANPN